VKVRIGMGLGNLQPDDDVAAMIDLLEALGVDSLWFSEVVHAPQLDPVVGLAYAVARTRALKVGTGVMVLPGRHPLLVAKQLASLARLAPKRILPVFGLHSARPAERPAFPVPQGQRGALFDESLMLVREFLSKPRVTFHGDFFTVDDAGVGFVPERPLDLWLGGSAPAALSRIGRLADGWLASFITPAEAANGIEAIRAAATEAGREVDEDHYGLSLAVAFEEIPPELVEAVRRRRPDLSADQLVPVGWDAASSLMRSYIDAGISKFVIRPAARPESWAGFVHQFAEEMLPLQT